MIFKTSLDTTTKLITIAITLLFLGISLAPYLLESTPNEESSPMVLLILGLTYGISYGFSPKSYEISQNNLIIYRPFCNVILNRTQIKEVFKLEKGQLSWSIRTFGVGGLFGYFGTFWNKKFGNMTWYATRRDNAIMVITHENKKIMLTPDETEKFIYECSKLKEQPYEL